MAGLTLHTSNRLEKLCHTFAALIKKQPLASPLEPEIVVVQSRGMARYLSLQLAERTGICANTLFPFPNRFLQSALKAFFSDIPNNTPYDIESLRWAIMRTLPEMLNRPSFEPLRHYLDDDATGLKLFEVSGKIADLFDQYTLYRPEWIWAWENNRSALPGDEWQAQLWQITTLGWDKTCLRPALLQRLMEMAQSGRLPIIPLPERVSIFGISALPPYHLDILHILSAYMNISLFLLEPCREYWLDLMPERTIVRMEEKSGLSRDILHTESGNPLLLSLGQLGRDFLSLVEAKEAERESDFEPSSGHTLLEELQNDILLNITPSTTEKRVLNTEDFSLQIHACHNPLREVEVLQDQLYSLFERLPGLEPKDILIIAPDISCYAPYLQSLFLSPAEEYKRLPCTIADRPPRETSGVIRAFHALLLVHQERYKAGAVLSALEEPCIRERFELSESEIIRIRGWVESLKITFSVDGAYKRQLGLPESHENSWRFGLERLLLGYMMPLQEKEPFAGILPFDEVEGESATTLGKLADFLEKLFVFTDGLEGLRSPSDWANHFTLCLEGFFSNTDPYETDLQMLKRGLDKVKSLEMESRFSGRVGFETALSFIREYGESDEGERGFLSGSITCCTLLPMRSIPFRVICMLGMNDGAFPRETRHQGFDLMAQEAHPRKGDRSRREDDRYLFLETLLSARSVLYISYEGYNTKDNLPTPPSLLISELTDYMMRHFTCRDRPVAEQLIRHHKLQPFSPAYFSPGKMLFSYSAENYAALMASIVEKQEAPPFINRLLPEWESLEGALPLSDLLNFYRNPVAFFLEKRLAIRLDHVDTPLSEAEPFFLNPLDGFKLRAHLLRNKPLSESLCRLKGVLPHGTPGHLAYHGLETEMALFLNRVHLAILHEEPVKRPFELTLGPWRLTGEIDFLYSNARIVAHPASYKPVLAFRQWIIHLINNLPGVHDTPLLSRLFFLDKTIDFPPLDNSRDILETLLSYFLKGQSAPLPFFSNSSLACAESMMKRPDDKAAALHAAFAKWKSNAYVPGEEKEPAHQIVFRDHSPLDDRFLEIAQKLYCPLLSVWRQTS
ncbi:MAG: exodeoxyribonuclease V subunit gamma [Elusimicrobia bacterium RIFOXYB2_FULL_49_7]|nr:MAG: exodeoxyribonuclease V subunit gamma [Elusimicrobia bacterium RIFOXYB2_FULL_49_7]